MLKRFFTTALLCLSCTACAPVTASPEVSDEARRTEVGIQKRMLLVQNQEFYERALRIYWPIARNNWDQCGDDIAWNTGIRIQTRRNIDEDLQKAFIRLYNLEDDENAEVIFVVTKGSPADAAGFKVGDRLHAFNGKEKSTEEIWEQLVGKGPHSVTVKRDGKLVDLQLSPIVTCNYPLFIMRSEITNAFADGESIVVTDKMMVSIREDQELALILAHELAHNTMKHIQAGQVNALAGQVLGLTLDLLLGTNTFSQFGQSVGQRAYSQGFEFEADYVGTYYVARAGYDVDGIANTWRHMAMSDPHAITVRSGSHPSAPERFLAIEQTSLEIQDKIAQNQPLLPEYKNQHPAATNTQSSQP